MNVVYAVATAMVPLPDGGRYTVRAGTHWLADDPVVLAQPGLFSDDPTIGLNYSVRPSERPVETASAAPGEKRQRGPVPGPRRGE